MKKLSPKFKQGDVILKNNTYNYSYASMWTDAFTVMDVNNKHNEYVLRQTNLITNQKMDFIDNNFYLIR